MLDRRSFLTAAGLAAASALLPRVAFAQEKKKRKTKRVVFVAFAGGVRTKDTFGAPENVPNLLKIAKEGVILPHVQTRNIGHYGSALALFTGQLEEKIAKENERSGLPTVFEYVRKQRSLDARDVWLATSGGDKQLNYAYGIHPEYGSKYGARLVAGEGLLAADWRPLVEKFGRPKAADPKEQAKLDELSRALQPAALEKDPGSPGDTADADALRRLEKLVLDEVSGGNATLMGTGAGDARAIRMAKAILTTFRPVLTGVALSNADVAHGSVPAYFEVVKRNDAELGALWAAVQGDPELKGSTSIIIVPEFGRDAAPNQRNGLDHADNSPDMVQVACVAAGPDFRQGAVVQEEVRATQLCPTICELLGASADKVKEKPIHSIFA
jgi:hypothetical protein